MLLEARGRIVGVSVFNEWVFERLVPFGLGDCR
jgi:hypothetical protein